MLTLSLQIFDTRASGYSTEELFFVSLGVSGLLLALRIWCLLSGCMSLAGFPLRPRPLRPQRNLTPLTMSRTGTFLISSCKIFLFPHDVFTELDPLDPQLQRLPSDWCRGYFGVYCTSTVRCWPQIPTHESYVWYLRQSQSPKSSCPFPWRKSLGAETCELVSHDE